MATTVTTVRERIDAQQTALARADTKALGLLAGVGAALTIGVSRLADPSLPTVAAVIGWIAAALAATAVVLLAVVIRPARRGPSSPQTIAALSAEVIVDVHSESSVLAEAEELRAVASIAAWKFAAIDWAIRVLAAGGVLLAVTVVLA